MIDKPEFIVESIDTSDDTWKFFNNIQDLKEIKTLGHFPKKFTSLATNATIFRWKFGDQPGDPIIETTVNPYIHVYHNAGTYSVSHQSCYPCVLTGTLTCSNGWCTKSIKVIGPGNDSLVALAGLAGLFIVIKGEDCCGIRKRCVEKRAICATVKPEDIENTKACQTIEKTCIERLEDCKEKCVKIGHIWQPLPYRCVEKHKPHKEVCPTIEQKKRYNNKDKIITVDK